MKLSLLYPSILRSAYYEASLLPDRSFYPLETAIEDYIHLLSGNYVNRAAYYRMIYELGEAYQRVERFQEAEYCSGMLKEERVENGKM